MGGLEPPPAPPLLTPVLKSLGHEPPGSFITSLLEMKLDPTTMFEWQRHSQEYPDVPDCQVLLDFLNLRAQAAEATTERKQRAPAERSVNSLLANPIVPGDCIACGGEKHLLYACP